jgi:hypothetical protein
MSTRFSQVPLEFPSLGIDLFDSHPDIANAATGIFEIVTVTTNSCQDIAPNGSYDPMNGPLPSIDTSTCPELNTPKVTSFPGYFSAVASKCVVYPSVQNYFGSVVGGKLQEQAIDNPVPLHVTLPILL